MAERFTVGVVVANHFGVLNRVAGMYAKRGYNIDSLAVGETENPAYSRITIVSTGDDYMKDQVVRQLEKLHDVKMVALLDSGNSVTVEHMLIKLEHKGAGKTRVTGLINDYGGKVMDFSNDFVTAEITGNSEQIGRFIDEACSIGILEVCRSGLIALAQGTDDILNINDLKKSGGKENG